MEKKRTWSSSGLSQSKGGCPAKLHDACARRKAARQTLEAGQEPLELNMPSEAQARGTAFHRIAESAARMVHEKGIDPEDAVERAILEYPASAEVASLIRKWHDDGCLFMENVIGFELPIALTDSWELCDFNDPDAAIRMIIDRFEQHVDQNGNLILVVIDYKSGYSGWSFIQKEIYMLGALAWMQSLEWDEEPAAIECRIYTPEARRHIPFRIELDDAAALEALRLEVLEAIAAAERLMRQPADREVIGPACEYCDRQSRCTAFQALPNPPTAIRTPEEAVDALRRFLALDTAKGEAAKALQKWVKTQGPIELDGMTYCRHANEKREPNGIALYRELLKAIGLDTDPEDLDMAAAQMNLMAPPGKTQVDAAAKALKDKTLVERCTVPTIAHQWDLK